jgi:hypothetical protein
MGCVVVVSADKDQCICANGKPDCGQSPMCLKEFNSIYTGECIGGECKAQNIDLASSCTTDLQCWDGSGNGMNAVAKCCENSKCEGPIENCKDDHMPVCPPGFKDVGEGFGCVPDCPASGNGCQTDEDCKKGGQNKVCVELTKDSFMTDKEVGLEACKLKGITKQCEFKKGAGAPSSTPPADIPFSIPSAAGLNNLSVDSVPKLIGNIIEKLMGVMGSIALAMFVYGGVLWMISAGNSEKSKKGMQIIVWSALGIMVILASYVIVGFVFEAFK